MDGADGGTRWRGSTTALAVLALLAWGVLVATAVAQGRQLRAGDGSWPLLVVSAAGAALCLYAAAALASRARRAPTPTTAPRHRR